MNRFAFYVALRKRDSGVFGTSLSQRQVDGINALLDILEPMMSRGDVTDMQAAYILATAYHETGGTMAPVREAFASSDDGAISRLDRAWKAGKLPWVRAPYWRRDRDGKAWYGRGLVQLTHKRNYKKLGDRIGVDLIDDPDKVLDLNISAMIIVVGMVEGLFTGVSLSVIDEEDFVDARRVVNSMDKANLIAKYAIAFLGAIRAAGSGAIQSDKEDEIEGEKKEALPEGADIIKVVLSVIRWILSIFKK